MDEESVLCLTATKSIGGDEYGGENESRGALIVSEFKTWRREDSGELGCDP